MPRLITNFNWGAALRNANPELTRQLSESYTDTALIVNTKVSKYITNVDPTDPATPSQFNKNLEIGDIWVNTATDNAWIMTSRTTDLLVTWKQIT